MKQAFLFKRIRICKKGDIKIVYLRLLDLKQNFKTERHIFYLINVLHLQKKENVDKSRLTKFLPT